MVGAIAHTFVAKNGLQLTVRPIQPEDAPLLVDLFEHMGPNSRYLRFNQSLNNPDPKLVWAEARRLANFDPEQAGAWLAFADLPGENEAPVAGVRYVRISEDAAEASLVVRDDLQDIGIGTELARFLVKEARAAGLLRLTASIQAGNRRLWHILHKMDVSYRRELSSGYATVEVELASIGEPSTF